MSSRKVGHGMCTSFPPYILALANERDYRSQAHRTLVFGHQLLLRVLKLQNSRFDLGMEDDVQTCFKAFTEIVYGNIDVSNALDRALG